MKELTLDDLKTMHDRAYDYCQETRIRAADDMVFYYITQWDSALLENSSLTYKGEFDVIRKAGRKIVSEMYENEIQIDFDPIEDDSEDLAELMDGLYRRDSRGNDASEAEEVALNEAIICGVGAYELTTDYKTIRNGVKDLKIKYNTIHEANNVVFWDPNATAIDKRDAKYCSVLSAYTREGYVDLVKDLTGEELDPLNASTFKMPEHSYVFPWINGEVEHIYVTKFYHVVEKMVKMVVIEDVFGETTEMPEDEFMELMDELASEGVEIKDEYEIKTNEVMLYIASGMEILHKQVIAGQHIPVIPVYGEYAIVESEPHYEGVVRLAKDPQRLRNFAMSYLADIVSRSPREKPILSPSQIQGFEQMYEDNGAENNFPYALMNDFDQEGNQLGKEVGVLPAPNLPPAMVPLLQFTRESIEDVASDGNPQDYQNTSLIRNISGVAVEALQKRIDMQSMVYQKHREYMKRREAEIYASIASVIYDTPRKEKIVSPDGTSKYVDMMQTSISPSGETVTLRDLRNKEFIIATKLGVTYETKRDETIQDLKERISQLDPTDPMRNILQLKLMQITPGAIMEDMRDYARKQLLLMGVQKPDTPEEEQMVMQAQEAQANQPDPNMLIAQSEMLKGQAELLDAQIKAKEIGLDYEVDLARLNIEAYDSITKRMDSYTKAEKVNADFDVKTEANRLKSASPIEKPRTDTSL